MIRIVITGGPCTGKTSLIDALSAANHQIFPEVARRVIQEQLEINSNKVPWDDVSGFSKLVLKEQQTDYHNAQYGLNFYDRGIPDIIGYMNYGNQRLFSELEDLASTLNYNHVFILPPWEEIYETDNERRENFSQATDLFEEIKNAYKLKGYSPIEVPKLSIPERIQFISNHING